MASTIKPDSAREAAEQERAPALAPFRSRDFSLLWFGSFVSQAGSQMHVVAVSWQVYELTKNPLALGAIGIARIVPLVLLALGSGVLADALDGRKLMRFSQIALMLCSDTVSMVVRGTIRQLATPDEMRGRMTAVGMLAGGPQLGEIEAGVAARLMGGPLSVAAGGLACIIMVGVLTLLTPQLRRYDGFHQGF